MTGSVLAVHQAEDDQPCPRCGGTIERGRRLAVVAGVGAVHIACVIACQPVSATTADQGPADPVADWSPVAAPGGDAATRWAAQSAAAGGGGQDATSPPAATTPRPPPAPVADDDDRGDPRQTPWWQW